MIVVTGARGFIGSHIVRALDPKGHGHEVLLVDRKERIQPGDVLPEGLFNWLAILKPKIEAIVHMGACTDTTCEDWSYLTSNNIEFSCDIWKWCAENGVRLIYASSGATYGDGSNGFSDDHAQSRMLHPLNMYGWSKHIFDLHAMSSKKAPPFWAGLKFTNVYGPGEDNKGSMASMVHQAFVQARTRRKVRLFNFGEQQRDFVYVGDVVNAVKLLLKADCNGIYNVGCGRPETFSRMVELVFEALGERRTTEYFEMPAKLEPLFQRYTIGATTKLKALCPQLEFMPLEMGIPLMAKHFQAPPAS